MGNLIARILQMFRKKEEPDSTEEAVLDFLSKKPGTEERARAVEGIDFLNDLRTERHASRATIPGRDDGAGALRQ